MTRKLVAAYACRAGGTRLYGKPLQNLEAGHSILDQLLAGTKVQRHIEDIVLGIAEGIENQVFVEQAKRHGIKYITGSEKDVLHRLVLCGREVGATDVFRITTECPFPAWELLDEAWSRHVEDGNDITVTDFLPEGMNYEIYTQEALERAHHKGRDEERSEYCSAYFRRRPEEFKIGLIKPLEALQRLDLRLTVDFPEDLILCRDAYQALKDKGPTIPVADVINFVDAHPNLHALVERFVDPVPIWASVLK